MTYDEEINEYRNVIQCLERTITNQEKIIKNQDETILNLERQIKLIAQESFTNREIVKKAIKDIRKMKTKIKGKNNDLLE